MAAGVLLDIDGVLTVSWKALPGARETLDWLEAHDLDFRLVTNTSSKSRHQIAEALARAGLPVDRDRILTAVSSAAQYLRQHHRDSGCFVVNDGSLDDDLEGIQITGPADAGVVLLGGAGPTTGYQAFDTAFKLAAAGTPVVALLRNARYQTAEGPALDMGAFIVGLEAAAAMEVTVVGKPAPAFFSAALSDLGIGASDALMVGDDINSDVLGSQAVGMTGVLVRTGKFRPSDLDLDGTGPDHVIDDIGQLPQLLRQLQAGGRG
jgi:HAD superfamily hydrolase (TIGR01458 family)